MNDDWPTFRIWEPQPWVPACAGTTVVQRSSSAGTTGVEAFTSSTLEELLAWPYTPASSTILAPPPYTSS